MKIKLNKNHAHKNIYNDIKTEEKQYHYVEKYHSLEENIHKFIVL